jgi:hypothetical protein
VAQKTGTLQKGVELVGLCRWEWKAGLRKKVPYDRYERQLGSTGPDSGKHGRPNGGCPSREAQRLAYEKALLVGQARGPRRTRRR